MKQLSNLPPGCRESDIPGNSAADAEFEFWMEEADAALTAIGVDRSKMEAAQDRAVDAWLSDYYTNNYDYDAETRRGEPSAERAAEVVFERLNDPQACDEAFA